MARSHEQPDDEAHDRALAEGRELKPFSLAYRVDGQQGIAVSFPLLVLKNVPEPLSGGTWSTGSSCGVQSRSTSAGR